jgi:hypothetical protein
MGSSCCADAQDFPAALKSPGRLMRKFLPKLNTLVGFVGAEQRQARNNGSMVGRRREAQNSIFRNHDQTFLHFRHSNWLGGS